MVHETNVSFLGGAYYSEAIIEQPFLSLGQVVALHSKVSYICLFITTMLRKAERRCSPGARCAGWWG